MDLELRSWFSRLPMSPHFNFAAVPGLVDGGDGGAGDGGAGGGDEGGGDGGDEGEGAGGAGDGGEGDETDLGDEGAGDGEGEGDEGEGEGDEGGKGDKGKVPADVNAALKKMREVDAKAADLLRKSFYKASDYAKVGTLDEVRAMKDTLDDLGGEEGIQTMRGKVTDYATELMRFAEGDPSAVDDLFKDYAEGGFKLVPIGVNKMRALEMDEATGLPKADGHYAHLQARLTAEAWQMYGAAAVLEDALRIAHDGGTNAQARVIEKLDTLKKWADGVSAFARRRMQNDEGGEGKSKLDKQRQDLENEKTNLYRGRVGTAVVSQMNQVVSRFLNPKLRDYAKANGKPMKLASKQDLYTGITMRMSKALESNSRYQTQVKAMIANGDDPEKIARFCRTYMDKLGEKVTNSVWEVKGHNNARGKAAARGAAGAGGSGSAARTGKKPDAAKIDWSKDPSRMRYMAGEATLKKEFGGGVVRWNRDAL